MDSRSIDRSRADGERKRTPHGPYVSAWMAGHGFGRGEMGTRSDVDGWSDPLRVVRCSLSASRLDERAGPSLRGRARPV
jgi:hypothetical protein